MALLTRWDPLRTLTRLQDEMGQLFDDRFMEAESKHGVLTVTVPKRPEAKPRTIQVKVS